MAVVIIKDSVQDYQATVTSAGALLVTPTGGGGLSNVNIFDSNGNPIDSTGGALNVTFGGVNPNQTLVCNYNTETAVAVGVQTTVVTFTAPASPTISYLQSVSVSGQNVAQWILDNNGTVFDQRYTTAALLGAEFNFLTGSLFAPGLVITPGNIVTISVIQIGLSSANFNARIQVLEVG